MKPVAIAPTALPAGLRREVAALPAQITATQALITQLAPIVDRLAAEYDRRTHEATALQALRAADLVEGLREGAAAYDRLTKAHLQQTRALEILVKLDVLLLGGPTNRIEHIHKLEAAGDAELEAIVKAGAAHLLAAQAHRIADYLATELPADTGLTREDRARIVQAVRGMGT